MSDTRTPEPDAVISADTEAAEPSHARRGLFALNRSPLTRKVLAFNLIALNLMLVGVLVLLGAQGTAYDQRADGLRGQAALLAQALSRDPQALTAMPITEGVLAIVLDEGGAVVDQVTGRLTLSPVRTAPGASAPDLQSEPPTVISDFFAWTWDGLRGLATGTGNVPPPAPAELLRGLVGQGAAVSILSDRARDSEGHTVIYALAPMTGGDYVGLVGSARDIDLALRSDRERVLQFAALATLISIFLSLVLAATIANPISDLADAAEIRTGYGRANRGGGRIFIPDLTDRPDEIGRLSGSLRSMVNALYDQIDGNEQFAADVSHEIKNPLASLRSAVGSLRRVKRDDQRDKLLNVIEHDVRRLDRLVTDISNASRLDSELVKEDEVEFNLLDMIGNLAEFMGEDARRKGIEFISDLPEYPIYIHGLDARLAQVFVNLISNAISFCEDGDALRVWARRRDNRVLVVVEDTGPGIPENALDRIFRRFYTSRPDGDFGNNSGLGLAISKQIVEAHGGVIWAENIRPTDADPTSAPLGARFVVGLPV